MTPRICVAHPSEGIYSETFVRAHVRRLPAEVFELSGGLPPSKSKGKWLVGQTPFHKAARHALRRVFRLPPGHFHAKAVAKFLRANRIDAVLAEYGPTGVHLLGPCREAGVPLTVHFHGYDAHSHDTLQEYFDGYKRLFAGAAAFVAVSREMEAHLVSLGAPREKTHYNPCGVDLAQFSEADPASAPPTFVAAGRFVEKKAPFLAVMAFAKARETRPDARLVMFGDGPLLGMCRKTAVSLGVADAVEFAGPRPHEEIAAAMARARAFVQHSVRAANGDSEGTPVAVLEAAASGLPVVATAHAGIKDVVADGETGFLVREGDFEAMGEAMARLAADAALAGRIGKAARRMLPERYHMETNLKALCRVLEGTIAKK